MFSLCVTGDIKVEILNKKGEKVSKLPGTAATSKKLLVELKVIWHCKFCCNICTYCVESGEGCT